MKNEQSVQNQSSQVKSTPPLNQEAQLPIPNKNKPWPLILLIVLLLGSLIALAYKYNEVKQQLDSQRLIPTPSPQTIVSSPSPASSPTPENEQPTSTDTNTNIKTTSATLVSTKGWTDTSVGNLNLKIPPQASIEKGTCALDYEECYLLKNHDENLLSPPHISIQIKAYGGGSRRQEADLEASNYDFKEVAFGSNKALVGFYNCPIDNCTSLREILLVVGNKLIHITDGDYKNTANNSVVKESSITNAIVSSLSN